MSGDRELIGRAQSRSRSGGFGFDVTIADEGGLDRAQRLLAGISGGLEKAVKAAMSRAVSHMRSENVKAVRERHAIKATNVRDEENVKVSYSYENGVQAHISFSGRRIPLYRFDGAAPLNPTKDTSRTIDAIISGEWRTTNPSVAAQGHVLKDTSPVTFDEAFVARMANGHTGIFERTGGSTSNGTDAIRELFGPSVPQMLGYEDVREKLTGEAMEKFDERLDHEVQRILNGWGG